MGQHLDIAELPVAEISTKLSNKSCVKITFTFTKLSSFYDFPYTFLIIAEKHHWNSDTCTPVSNGGTHSKTDSRFQIAFIFRFLEFELKWKLCGKAVQMVRGHNVVAGRRCWQEVTAAVLITAWLSGDNWSNRQCQASFYGERLLLPTFLTKTRTFAPSTFLSFLRTFAPSNFSNQNQNVCSFNVFNLPQNVCSFQRF